MLQPIGGGQAPASAPRPTDPDAAARQLLSQSQNGGQVDIGKLATGYTALRTSNPTLADSVRAHLDQGLTPVQQGVLSARVDAAPATPAGPSGGDLALDVTQIGLDIAGIVDPTPISDGSNAVISLFRGDWGGAGISALGIIPYVGDTAKLAKLGKWGETLGKAVDFAKVNRGFAKTIEPALSKIADAIRAAPLDKLPAGARQTLEGIAAKIEGHLAQSARVTEAARASGLSEAKVSEILGTPKGSRPPASAYMSDADIAAHLKPFEDSGAVRFTTKSGVDKYGTLGPANGTFTIPRSELDRVIRETGGDLGKIEQKLGLDAGTLSNGDTLIAYIKPENLNNLRVPSGNEAGANTYWVPGGRTSGGVPEATVDVPAGTRYTPISIQP